MEEFVITVFIMFAFCLIGLLYLDSFLHFICVFSLFLSNFLVNRVFSSVNGIAF